MIGYIDFVARIRLKTAVPKAKRKIRGQDVQVIAVLDDGTEERVEGIASVIYQVEGERGVATIEIMDPEVDLVGEIRGAGGDVFSA